ncbi:hypothetical protein GCM10028785_30410 [Hydrogenophaga soli]
MKAHAGQLLVPDAPDTPSPAAKAYQFQLARIAKLKSQMAEMDALATAHRQALVQQVFPLDQQRLALMKDLVLWLDPRLPQADDLSAPQRQAGQRVLVQLARELVQRGHADMAAVHDRHSPRTLAQLEQDRVQAARQQLEAWLGEPLLPGQATPSWHELMHAARARLQQANDDKAARTAERQSQREAKRDAKKEAKRDAKRQATRDAQGHTSPPAPAALPLLASLQDDAHASLRSLYRQLASALHPDREPDPDARQRKTALMSEANAAYARKDYLALQDLQRRAALDGADAQAPLPDDKCQALTLLLKAQVADLERERARTQQSLLQEFEVPQGQGLNAETLQAQRDGHRARLKAEIDRLQAEREALARPGGLKRLTRWPGPGNAA